MAESRYIGTQRDGRKLVFNDFMYTKKNRSATSTYWSCVKRDSDGCRASAITGNMDERLPPRLRGEHNHLGEAVDVEVSERYQQIRERARATQDRPAVIRLDVVSEMHEDAQEIFPQPEAVRRTIQRVRSGQNPPNVALPQLTIDGRWAETIGEHQANFLIEDNRDDRNRCIVFSSPQCLALLSQAQCWYMDGNFAMAPHQFQQLYIIRVPLGDGAITAVYALLQRKTREAYTALLNALVAACQTQQLRHPQPVDVHCDFELAAHQAVRDVFPHSTIRACFYHLTQSTWRKIQNLGLTEVYKNSQDVRNFVGMVDGLAFLPLANIYDGMAHIRANTPNGFDGLVDYFDQTYVAGVRQAAALNNGNIGLRVHQHQPPLFPTQVWNVNRLTLEGGARTNNTCESWNQRFKHLIGYNHPSVWKLIEVIQKEDAHDRTKIRRYNDGHGLTVRTRPRTRAYCARLKTLCERFRDGIYDVPAFLERIGRCIRAM